MMSRWAVLPTWLRPVGSAVIAAIFSTCSLLLWWRFEGHWSNAASVAWWFVSAFAGGCIGDYIYFRWKGAPIETPVVPADPVRDGWLCTVCEQGFYGPGRFCSVCGRPLVQRWRNHRGEFFWYGPALEPTARTTPPTSPEQQEPNKKETSK
jgi:hypothetical protein